MKTRHIEIMAPAGSYPALAAAIRSGAGSIYFGVGRLNMRARAAASFELRDLKRIARICRWCGVRAYLALNTLVFDEELADVRALCEAAARERIDAVIATDMATIQMARRFGLEVHVSVQANLSNLEAVRFYARYADTMVLARELSLEQIEHICRAVRDEPIVGPSGRPVSIEIFVHGALCVAYAGTCHMSLAVYNTSANRGACLQNCRRRYRVMDDETGDELVVENHHVMSPRDLCTVGELHHLVRAGARVFKIEGRGRTADYVATVTRVYKEALAALEQESTTPARIDAWKAELRQVYNRGFWDGGYYCGKRLDQWSVSAHSQATLRREQIGIVGNYYGRIGVVQFQLKRKHIELGADLLIEGPTTGALRCVLSNMQVDGVARSVAHKDELVTFAVPRRVRRNDKLFLHTE